MKNKIWNSNNFDIFITENKTVGHRLDCGFLHQKLELFLVIQIVSVMFWFKLDHILTLCSQKWNHGNVGLN